MKELNFTNIKKAFLDLSQITEKKRNSFLINLSKIIWKNKNDILLANQKDLEEANNKKLSKAFIERLILDESGIKKIIQRLESMQNLNANLGEIIESRVLKNKIKLKKIRTSIGVIAVIYESRPEVTIDVAALCIKSGNVAILKGGSDALSTNKSLYNCIDEALKLSNIEKSAISFVSTRDEINQILKRSDLIDLIIVRGGYDLVKTITNKSKIPILAHAAGGARIYIDKSADLKIAEQIVINAKINKPSACNCVDTILIHHKLTKNFLIKLIKKLQSLDIEILGDEYVSKLTGIKIANQNDWDTEFLDLRIAIKVVADIGEAIQFINKHSKKHSEGIIALDQKAINSFVKNIDTAAVFINCSTRLHDGYVFGLGSEIGIATGKLHARGPVGLKELTTYKWQIYGNGHLRE